MPTDTSDSPFGPAVETRLALDAQAVVVCEHASNRMPDGMAGLGLDAEALAGHIAWDPGALPVAKTLAARLGATLVAGRLSRLIYDCNRPPSSAGAIVETSEVHAIPGNRDLPAEQRATRVAAIHDVFHEAAERALGQAARPVLITVHSFTPVFRGRPRAVELGLIYGDDPRLAKTMLETRPDTLPYLTRLNEPYDQTDGVTYTIDRHGAAKGRINVMIELRSDRIATQAAQEAAAAHLAPWIEAALTHVGAAA